MNLEKVSMLSQKIEGVLGLVRTLKEENARIRRELSPAKDEAQDKTMLLDSASKKLADCMAALDARANQANVQQDQLNQKAAEIAELTEKSTVLGQQLIEKDGCIESLNDKVRELSEKTDLLNGQLNEKMELLSALDAQIAEKDSMISNLMEQLSSRGTEIENLNVQLQAQNEEIAEAQERFTQLVETIESELGTDISLDQGEEDAEQVAAEAADEESLAEAPTAEEAEADLAAESPVEEPAEDAADVADAQVEDSVAETSEESEPADDLQIDESVSQEEEEDLPTIEVHGADEQDNDLFASKSEGSQTSFFG
jgi:chromosome segregation ATPase